jgi:hypothetical protein
MFKRTSIAFTVMAIGIGVILLSRGMMVSSVSAQSSQARSAADTQIFLPLINLGYPVNPLWRFGVAPAVHSVSDYPLPSLAAMRFGWYSNWSVTPNAPRPVGMEYAPVVRLKQWKYTDATHATWTSGICVGCAYAQPYTYTLTTPASQIQAAAVAQPGMTWFIGNEIERIDWNTGMQDEILPELYAQAYYETRNLILGYDSTAKIGIGGLIQATPIRLEYLDRVLAEYQSRYGHSIANDVDIWNVHGFILNEQRDVWGADIPAGFTQNTGTIFDWHDNRDFVGHGWPLIVAMRQWMATNGLRDKPLYINEYGVNMPDVQSAFGDWFSPVNVRNYFMYPSFNYFLNQTNPSTGYTVDGNRLVQRWMWYSLDGDPTAYNGNLFNNQTLQIASLGNYWAQYVQALPSGSVKPYTPQSSSPRASVSAAPVTHVDCGGKQPVRLLYYEPSPPNFNLGEMGKSRQLVSAPRLMREETICPPK